MANKLLYPKFSSTRRVLDLGGMWRFKFDRKNEGETQNWKDGLKETTLVPVPSSFNDLFTDKDSREFTGDIWYETDLYVPNEWKEFDLDLRFSGVTHKATVYVNGIKVKEHNGGYTPFNATIQEVIDYKRKNKIIVKVSNELHETTLPVGETITLENGNKMVKSNAGLFNYAGIQRPVKLVATPKESIVDFTVRFELKGTEATVFYTVATTGGNEVFIEVYDEFKNLVTTATGKENSLTIKEVNLWKPLAAYLYTFKLQIKTNEGVIDEYSEEIGIRTVEVKGNQLYINNESVYLKGFAKQEDSDLHGAGFNPAVLKRDFELMKWAGSNSFRTSSYPHSEELYQMADREGFIVIDEVPATGLTVGKPNFFQMISGDKDDQPFFAREHVQTETKESHLAVLSEMIQRDKNHACVCIWSLLNEPDTEHESVVPYVKAVFEKTHQLDEQKRPRTLLLSMSSTPETSKIHDLCDIVSLNRFYGWDVLGGYELSDAEEEMEEEMASWAKVEKPILFTAYGAESIPGEFKLPSVQWSENYQVEVLRMQHRIFDRYAFIRGEQVWSFSDYQTPENLTAIDGNKSGIFTRNRQPKVAAYLIKDRWDNIPLNYKC
jgi:beta-glucuronidase